MFLEYQSEIIGLVVILLLLLIYFFIKMKRLKEQIQQKSTLYTPDLHEESDTQEHIQENEVESLEELEGSLEGDFGIQESEVPQKYKRKSDIKKRDIPRHGKITKEQFKEFAGTKILVAEDNLINQKVISGLLGDSGIKLTMANDGQEVFDILEKDDDFLMILMDANMPRVDGFQATREIRANPKYNHIVVVALSGDTATDDVKRMSEAGMAEHLEKPLRMDSLYDVLYAYSNSKEEEEEEEEEKTHSDATYIEVPMTKELHGDKGLAICGGDEKFYLEILREFVNTYADSAHKLRALLTDSQVKTADKLLLDIIGVSANIGAEEFTKAANNLKETLQDTEEKSYFTNLEQYQSHLQRLVKDIKDFINR